MDIERVTSAVRELAELGRDRFEVVLRDGTSVVVPMGLDNVALTFGDQDGWVTFRVGGKPRTAPIRLEEIVWVRDVRGTL